MTKSQYLTFAKGLAPDFNINQEVERPRNGLFYIVNSCFSQISCLGGSENSNWAILDGGGSATSKSAILDGKQLFISNQALRRFKDL